MYQNKSFLIGDDGHKYPSAGYRGVQKTAEEYNNKFLGEIPINSDVGK